MDLQMIPNEEILMKLLRKEFVKDFNEAKCCASDSLWIYRQNNELMEELFNKWLKREGYAK